MITVVGLGAEGWPGLAEPARAAITGAERLIGGDRHLELIPADATTAERQPWPSPMGPFLDTLASAPENGDIVILASGDPMLHGVGSSLAKRMDPTKLTILPAPSAFALACARLGWPEADTELVSVVGKPVELVVPALAPGRRLVIYVSDQDGARAVARVAREHGYGPSTLTVLEHLGGDDERIEATTADALPDEPVAQLHTVALHCEPAAEARVLPRTPGLPDDAFDHDGQVTKREARALTLAALAPTPGELLWDIGAGSGSIGIEWMRAHPANRAIAFEPKPDRAARARANASQLGVPTLTVIEGSAPAALDDQEAPDAIFIGGGLTTEGVLATCLERLKPGGRLVATAVTIETEQVLIEAQKTHGGRLTKISVQRAEPLGGFTAWRPHLPLTQWTLERPRA
ncbi:MAG: precorrin-6y C5,15-methyltransferase (decarboxylating) subunit CbiE [Solirubrobacteraceae bacterium]|nr:precorrin-6y C5,15-methyltransferase (decarboxylating) subunit CbiE [Solirubrobacteraceae bacterium]